MYLASLTHGLFIALNTTFIRCKHTCAVTHIRTALREHRSTSQPSILLPFFAHFPFPSVTNHLFYLLGNPLFDDRGANVHPHSSLVGDRLPTPCSLPSPSPPDGSHSSCYMFSETTSQHQLHCLIQLRPGQIGL